MRKYFAFFLVILAVGGVSASSSLADRISLRDWRWILGDNSSFASPSYDDGGWEDLSLPRTLDAGSSGSVFWMRAHVPGSALAPLLEDEHGLFFLSGKAGVALELYVDGVYMGSRGSLPPAYSLRSTQAGVIHIPPSFFEGEEVLIALRGAYAGTSPLIPLYHLGTESAAAFDLGPLNFWNGRLFLILAALCAFLGLYFFLQFVFRASERVNLYYALTLLFIALYFYEIGAQVLPFTGAWFRALARASLILSMAFLVPFMESFFGFPERRFLLLVPLALALVFTLAFFLVAGDEKLISLVFTLSLLPVIAFIVFSLVLALRARRQGSPEAITVIIGIGIGLGLSLHDIVYQARGAEPFAWLQGPAFFGLIIAIFVALSARQARLKTELERYAREAEEAARALEKSLSRLGTAGEEARAMGIELEEAIGKVAVAVEGVDSGLRRIESEAEGQVNAAGEAEALVVDFLGSIGRVNQNLAEQSASVEQTAAAATELSAGATSVADNIGRTAEFAAGLATLTTEGEQAARALGEAVGRVAEASRGITEIVDALNEFAERTNLLAMNAAIEAAHAGLAGKGFAIIASEIKGLAQAQAERAGRIRSIVAEIQERVSTGSRDAGLVGSSLREIAKRAEEAASRMGEAKAGMDEQQRASLEISTAMEALAGTGTAIRAESGRQTEGSHKVRGALSTVTKGSSTTQEFAVSIAKESAEIVDSVRRLRALAEKSRSLSEENRRLAEADTRSPGGAGGDSPSALSA